MTDTLKALPGLVRRINKLNPNVRIPLPRLAVPRDVYIFTRSPNQPPQRGRNCIAFEHFNLVFNLRGAGHAVIADIRHAFKPRGALLVFPGQPRRYEVDAAGDFLWVFCGFKIDAYDCLLPLRDRIIRLDKALLDAMVRVMSDYASAKTAKPLLPEHSVRLSLNLWTLLAQLAGQRLVTAGGVKSPARRIEPSALKSHDDLIARVESMLLADPAIPVSARRIASELGLSPACLNRQFRLAAGSSLGRFLRVTRVCRGRDLLNTTQLSVKEIAAACGFQSPFTFSRAFRKMTGRSPRQYRRSI